MPDLNRESPSGRRCGVDPPIRSDGSKTSSGWRDLGEYASYQRPPVFAGT